MPDKLRETDSDEESHNGGRSVRYHAHVRFVPDAVTRDHVRRLRREFRYTFRSVDVYPTEGEIRSPPERLEVTFDRCRNPATLETALTGLDWVAGARAHAFEPRDRAERSGTTGRRSGTARTDRDAHAEFKRLRAEHESEPDGISLDCPEYTEFLDAFDLLSDSFEDEPTIDELLDAEPDPNTDQFGQQQVSGQSDDEPSGATADGRTLDSSGVDTDSLDGPDWFATVYGETNADPTLRSSVPDEPSDAEDGSSTGREPADGADTADESELVQRLVAHLQNAANDGDREALREALGVESNERLQVQLDHLQARLSRFDAYVDALEDLLDDHGDGQTGIDELSAELEATRSDVAELREAVDAGAEQRGELETSVTRLRQQVDDVGDELERIETRTQSDVEALSDHIADLEETLDDRTTELTGELEQVRQGARENTEWRNRVTSAVQGESERGYRQGK